MTVVVKWYDLARMTTATVGTGTITLGVAVSPFLTFNAAGVQNGDQIRYSIYDPTVGGCEIGYGTYTTSGTTLTRNPTSSSNGNAAISLSGQAQVFITGAAADFSTAGASATAAAASATAAAASATLALSMPQKTVSASTYTLLAGDSGYWILFTNSGGCAVTVPNSFGAAPAWVALLEQVGAGVVTLTLASGATYSNSATAITSTSGIGTTIALGVQSNAGSAAVYETFAPPAGAAGSNGTNGANASFTWAYSSTTTMASPGTGAFRANNATWASVTNLAIMGTTQDSGNPNVNGYLANLPAGSPIIIRDITTPGAYAIFTSGTVTNNTTWCEIAVTYVMQSGTFTTADVCEISLAPAGAAGAAGGLTSLGNASSDTSLTIAGTGSGPYTGVVTVKVNQPARSNQQTAGYSTSSSSSVMAGYNLAFTPKVTGKFLVLYRSSWVNNYNGLANQFFGARYATSTFTGGAAASGTLVGGAQQQLGNVYSASGNLYSGISLAEFGSGLTVGTTYYFDIAMYTAGGAGTLSDVGGPLTVIEL